MFKDDLVTEYLLFKEGIKAQCRSMDDMTDREQAGLWLKLFGRLALTEYDAAHQQIRSSGRAYTNLWPEARGLIGQALKEGMS